MGPHSSSDDPTKYQTDIVKEGTERDPIIVTEELLKGLGYLNDEQIARIRTESSRIVNEKFDQMEKIPPPDKETLFDDVYRELNWILREQKGEIL